MSRTPPEPPVILDHNGVPFDRDVAKYRRPAQATGSGVEIGFAQDWNIALQSGSLVPGTSAWQMMRDLATMAEADETVGAMLWCISAMVAQISWKHEPQIDGKKSLADPTAMAMADFADSLLLDMDHSWGDHVDDALNMVWAGFSPIEMVTKQRSAPNSRFADGYYGFKRLSLRDPITIWGWMYDEAHQNVLAARQMTYWGSATIPMWKMLHYRTTMSPEKPMGKSLIRSAHRAWVLKNRIQDTEAIGIERELVGLPIVRVPQEDLDTANETEADNVTPTKAAMAARQKIQNAIQAATSMRFNKSGGLLLPSDTFSDETPTDKTPKYDFKIVTSGGTRTIDTRTVARDYDVAIARTVLMQFLHLGTRSSGSYGLSDDQSTMAVSSLTALAVKIAEEWNRKGLALIWSINAFDPKYMPCLRPNPLTKDGIQAVGALFAGLSKAIELWSTDVPMRVSIARAAGLDYDLAAQTEAAGTAAKAATMNATAPKSTFGAPPNQTPGTGDPEEP